MKKKILLLAALVSGFSVHAQTYVPVTVGGYTADVVANGTGAASASTTNDVDGGSYAFVAANYTNPSGQSPATALPVNGTITSVVGSTNGLTFQLAPYTGNNSLRISGTGTGTLTLAAPTAADQVFVLATSGSGTSSTTFTVNFTDGTSQQFTQTVADWFGGSGFAIQGISRVNLTNNGIQNSTTDPRLYQYTLALSAANIGKPIQSIGVNKTSAGGVLNVMGVSVRTVASSVANDVGITGILTPESGCGLTAQEVVTVTLLNFGVNPQSNIPVTYTLNGGTPVTETFTGTLASNTAANFSFTVPADLSAVGSYTLVVTSALSTDTEAGNNAQTKTVVVSQTPVMPVISVIGPTTFCAGNFTTLSASSATTGASYQWLFNGSPITGALGATYAAGSTGDYSVVANANGCSSAASAPIALNSTPAPFAPTVTANGPLFFCSGDSVVLTASSLAGGVSYQWLRDGSTIAGANANILTVTESGSYRALAIAGGCAGAASGAATISVTPSPVTPVVSLSGNTLISSAGVGNQWYLNGNLLPGATAGTYLATADGTYTTIVTENGCSSEESNAVSVIISGSADQLSDLALNVYPNPTTGVFSVLFSGTEQAELTVADITGKPVLKQEIASGENRVNLAGAANGVYLLIVKSGAGITVRKLILE